MKYKLIERANPQNREQKKLYASPVYEGRITKTELTKEYPNLKQNWQKIR